MVLNRKMDNIKNRYLNSGGELSNSYETYLNRVIPEGGTAATPSNPTIAALKVALKEYHLNDTDQIKSPSEAFQKGKVRKYTSCEYTSFRHNFIKLMEDDKTTQSFRYLSQLGGEEQYSWISSYMLILDRTSIPPNWFMEGKNKQLAYEAIRKGYMNKDIFTNEQLNEIGFDVEVDEKDD